MKTIVFTGGGTAGHVMPNIALIDILSKEYRCVYIGSDGMEKRLALPAVGEENYFEISAAKFRRKLTPQNLTLPFKVARSVKQCVGILKKLSPSLVFAKGGYVSFPVARAAFRLKIPVIIHESDASMGLANRLIKNKCAAVLTSFDSAAAKCGKNAARTGSPIRQSIYSANKKLGLLSTGFDGKRKIVCVVGGSLGAASLNKLLLEALPLVTTDYDVFLISGKGKKLPVAAEGFAQTEFADNIFDIFAAADVVVARSGANTVFELAAMRKPMVLIPLSRATRGEQKQNAEYFFEKGCCLTADEDALTPETLKGKIDLAIAGADKMKDNQRRLKPDGTKAIAEKIRQIAERQN